MEFTIRSMAAEGYSNKQIARLVNCELKHVEKVARGCRKKVVLTDSDKVLIIELYKELSIKSIAQKFSVQQSEVSNLLKSAGVAIRRCKVKKILSYLKANKGVSSVRVAAMFDVCPEYVKVLKSKAGLSKPKAKPLTAQSFQQVRDVEQLRVEGNSMTEACAIVGITVNAYYSRKAVMNRSLPQCQAI